MAANTIKIKQLDTNDLFSWLQDSLGQTVSPVLSATTHNYDEVFLAGVSISGPFVSSGTSNFSGRVTMQSGLTSNSGINVYGLISGQSLSIQNFNVPVATFQTINIGSMNLTGVPIYPSGGAVTAVVLPSGTVFGLKQLVNAPTLDRDASGQLMPATGSGVLLTMLCVSVGS